MLCRYFMARFADSQRTSGDEFLSFLSFEGVAHAAPPSLKGGPFIRWEAAWVEVISPRLCDAPAPTGRGGIRRCSMCPTSASMGEA